MNGKRKRQSKARDGCSWQARAINEKIELSPVEETQLGPVSSVWIRNHTLFIYIVVWRTVLITYLMNFIILIRPFFTIGDWVVVVTTNHEAVNGTQCLQFSHSSLGLCPWPTFITTIWPMSLYLHKQGNSSPGARYRQLPWVSSDSCWEKFFIYCFKNTILYTSEADSSSSVPSGRGKSNDFLDDRSEWRDLRVFDRSDIFDWEEWVDRDRRISWIFQLGHVYSIYL